jgi:hypothetical protein
MVLFMQNRKTGLEISMMEILNKMFNQSGWEYVKGRSNPDNFYLANDIKIAIEAILSDRDFLIYGDLEECFDEGELKKLIEEVEPMLCKIAKI